jgi:hypothetical protein
LFAQRPRRMGAEGRCRVARTLLSARWPFMYDARRDSRMVRRGAGTRRDASLLVTFLYVPLDVLGQFGDDVLAASVTPRSVTDCDACR